MALISSNWTDKRKFLVGIRKLVPIVMNHISIDESLDLFLTTLSYLDEKYINGPDEDIDYYILTELDTDAHSFLHSYTVNILVEARRIPKSVINDTDKLRNIIKDLIERKRTYQEIRKDPEWIETRDLASSILTRINEFRSKL